MLTALVAHMLALTLAHPGPPPGQAECKSAFGRTACGFGCIAAYGEVKCAQTPEGRCQAAYGEITCFDPERDRPAPFRPRPIEREPGPQAECRNVYGKTVCGYDCTSAYGEVKCAKTPLGVCHAAYGNLTCWDPPRDARGAKARCESAFGQVACGYGCVSAYGSVRCAMYPGGVCQAAYGQITCSD